MTVPGRVRSEGTLGGRHTPSRKNPVVRCVQGLGVPAELFVAQRDATGWRILSQTDDYQEAWKEKKLPNRTLMIF